MKEQTEIPIKPRRIRRYQLVQFKGVEHADVTFDDDSYAEVIGGNNGTGKSSFCDGFGWIMGGAKLSPGEPIQRGKKTALGRLELGDDVVITRTAELRDDDSIKTEVTFEFNGEVQGSPQTLCDALAGTRSTAAMVFDPSEFFAFDAKKKTETVKQLIGLDLSDLDEAEKEAETERLLAGREVTKLRGLAMVPVDDVQPVDVGAIATEYQAAVQSNEAIARTEASRASVAKQIEHAEERIRELTKELERWKIQLDADTEYLSNLLNEADELPAPIDLAPIQARMREAQSINERAAKAAQARSVAEAHAVAAVKHAEAEDRIQEIRQERAERIASAEFPLPGLSIENGELRFNGLPLEEDQLSQSEILRIALAIRIAVNPNLQFAVLKRAAFFDRKALAQLHEYARETGFILILERPDVDEAVTRFVVECGHVRDLKERA